MGVSAFRIFISRFVHLRFRYWMDHSTCSTESHLYAFQIFFLWTPVNSRYLLLLWIRHTSTSLHVFDSKTQTWLPPPCIYTGEIPKIDCFAVLLQVSEFQVLLAFGGLIGSDKMSNHMYVYDMVSNKWTHLLESSLTRDCTAFVHEV